MLKRLLDVPEGIDALAAVGTITKDDYAEAVEPLLDEARRSGRPLRLLVQIGPEYEGYTAGAAWEKTANAFRSPSLLGLFDGYAVVTDIGWLHEASRLMEFLVPFPLRVFHDDQRAEAIAWLRALPETHDRRQEREMTSTGTIVVGADGSPEAATALEYALRDAVRRGARLRIVAAAQLPQYWAGGYSMPALPPPDDIVADLESAVRQQLDDVLKAHPQLAAVPVRVEARIGTPGHVLLEAAAGADELVLGHRGRGAVGSAVLGSVGLHCVLHARCPVTVVRPPTVPVAVADTADTAVRFDAAVAAPA